MKFQDVQTPEQLMQYLDENFNYGVIDNNGNKYYNSDTDEFQNVCFTQWKMRSVEDMLKDGVGHCYDQVEIEREWFTNHGFEIKTFWISAYQEEIENSGFAHTYLIYKENNHYKIFEHSDYFNRGIHVFKNINDAVKWQSEYQINFATQRIKPENKYVTVIKEYSKPPLNINLEQYVDFVNTFKDYEV